MRFWVTAFLFLVLTSSATAQVNYRSTSQESIERQAWRPSVLVGPSWFLADFFEDNRRANGWSGRAGVEGKGVGVALSLTHWPDVSSFRLTSAQLEFDMSAAAGHMVSPHLVASIGYTRGEYLGTGLSEAYNGASAAFGLGVEVRPRSPFGVRADALVRTDDGGWNAELRVLGGWIPAPPAPSSGVDFEGEISWMAPLAGPWEAVEPAYRIGFLRPLGGSLSAALDLTVVHWRIPSSDHPRGYLWDTRAFHANPAIHWTSETLPVAFRVGPTIAAMGEGPDNGASAGAFARAFVYPAPFGVPLTLGAGIRWLARAAWEGISSEDHVGLVAGLGLRF